MPTPTSTLAALHRRSFDDGTKTYGRQYHWGSVVVQHTQPAPLRLDIAVNLTNTSPFPLVGGVYALFGDVDANPGSSLRVPCRNGSFPPDATASETAPSSCTPRDGLLPCSGCWNGCGDIVQCASVYPQAIPIDWFAGAIGFVQLTPNGSAAPHAPWNLTVGVLDVNGYHLVANIESVAVGATVSTLFSLRFGDGGGPGNATGPALALVEDVLSAFAATRPFLTPSLEGGPLGAMFGSGCGASCTCGSLAPSQCPNPRGWDGSIVSDVNVTSPEGVAAFQSAAVAWVNRSIECVARPLSAARMRSPYPRLSLSLPPSPRAAIVCTRLAREWRSAKGSCFGRWRAVSTRGTRT